MRPASTHPTTCPRKRLPIASTALVPQSNAYVREGRLPKPELIGNLVRWDFAEVRTFCQGPQRRHNNLSHFAKQTGHSLREGSIDFPGYHQQRVARAVVDP